MSKRLYVGNLAFSTTLDKLKETFSKYGEVEEATIVTNKYTGKSKGFGFVTYKNDADADKAKAELSGKEFEGRTLTINEATPFDPNKPRERRSDGFGGRGFGGPRRFGEGDGRRFGSNKRENRDQDNEENFEEEA